MFDNLLIHTVNVTRPDTTQGTSGGAKPNFTTVYTDLRCRVQSPNASWLIQYGRQTINITHSVYFNSNPDIRNGDRLTFNSRELLVKGIRDPQEDGRLKIVDCVEVT